MTIRKGKLKSWNDKKGFGFIQVDGSAEDVFVHISGFNQANLRPVQNQRLTFQLTKDEQGRRRAIDVSIPRAANRRSRLSFNSKLSIGFAVLFLAVIVLLANFYKLSMIVVYVFLLLSLISFFIYRMDKQAAENNYWRTTENTLHFLAVFGGWPGALIAQKIFRHKSRKTSFRVVFWLTLALNLGALSWLMTKEGVMLSSFLDELMLNLLAELKKFIQQ